ncbi:nucleotidyltransferase family protein [Methanobrevibacter filiformis]|uniref:Putative cytidyltransferase-related C-terminal region domain-containing protein n=1 Tax=Methanobrevibacter filiformis TaxID=55758 RepID=A0A166DPG6_9EURY|nr:nucleotidyltransferase family protein [Methanobrevibacter filiformis]KZX15820.1 hypothetical protein MBFIL_05860 [Methanobrevibacter filiformis]
MPSNDFVSSIIKKDRKTFFKDLAIIKKNKKGLSPNMDSFNEGNFNYTSEIPDNHNITDIPLIADFTEYNPLHNGHFHCMKLAKSKISNGIFVAIVPGLFERSGRGVPYTIDRYSRSEIAINVGADIVVEGPPMGVMGSGQYSLCLALMFKSLNTDYIPRGYKSVDGYDIILDRISSGVGVSPKPYKIVDMSNKEILLNGKLEEDNYVIVSLSKSLTNINFNFKNKFIFIERIKGVSGTLIRQAINSNNLNNVNDMLPPESIAILKREIREGRAPLHNIRYDEEIINSANKLSFDELTSLNLLNENTANNIINIRENKPFTTVEEVGSSISQGFSSHFKHRVLSVLETKLNNDIISNYIEGYPSHIRVLNYKNEHVLNVFKDKINRRIELCQ